MITNIATDRRFPLGHYWAILSKAYVGGLFKRLEASPADRYYMVMQVIHQADRPFTQQTLGDFLNVDKVSMVRIMDHLVARTLVERVNNPTDRREKFVVLTEKGKKAMKEITEGVAEVNARALDGFSEGEIDLLYAMLERMNENLSEVPSQKIHLNFKRSKR